MGDDLVILLVFLIGFLEQLQLLPLLMVAVAVAVVCCRFCCLVLFVASVVVDECLMNVAVVVAVGFNT